MERHVDLRRLHGTALAVFDASHHLLVIANLVQTSHQMVMKHPQNDSSKGLSTLLLAVGPLQWEMLNVLQFSSRTLQRIVYTVDSMYTQIGKPTTVKTMDWCSCVGVGKDSLIPCMLLCNHAG